MSYDVEEREGHGDPNEEWKHGGDNVEERQDYMARHPFMFWWWPLAQ